MRVLYVCTMHSQTKYCDKNDVCFVWMKWHIQKMKKDKKTGNNCLNGVKMKTKDINKRQIAFRRRREKTHFTKWQPIFYFIFCSLPLSLWLQSHLFHTSFFFWSSLKISFHRRDLFGALVRKLLVVVRSVSFSRFYFRPSPPLIVSVAFAYHLTIQSQAYPFTTLFLLVKLLLLSVRCRKFTWIVHIQNVDSPAI